MKKNNFEWPDDFFRSRKCDRCGSDEAKTVFILSWFTDERICMDCSDKESEIKSQLRAKGVSDAMEGCGFVPI